jgi:hypothetical protein
MFLSKNLPVLFKNATLKVNEENERFALVTFVLEPFTPKLAHELGEEVASHFYDDRGVVRPEFTKIGFQAQPGTRVQILTVRAAPDAPGSAEIQPLRIEGYEVSKPDPEKERLKLTMTASFSLAERTHRAFAIDRFGTAIYATFKNARPGLLDDMPSSTSKRLSDIADDFAAAQPKDTSVTITHAGRSVTITPEKAAAARKRVAARKRAKN